MLFFVASLVFSFVTLLMVLFVLFLQGKGDMGSAGAWKGSQIVFGGSGGQDYIGKTVWVLGALFMILALLVSKMQVRNEGSSVLTSKSARKMKSKKSQKFVEESLTKEAVDEVSSQAKD